MLPSDTVLAHGLWREDRLCLWAEDGSLPRRATARRPPRPHPFATVSGLSALGEERIAKATEDEVVLLLPGSASSPDPDAGFRLHAWRVPVLTLGASAAAEILRDLPVEGIGPELRYLAVVAEDAADLVRRGRVLPAVAGEELRWRPVLTGTDAERFRELAAAMPPVLRAVGKERPSTHVLLDALDALVDAAARRALGDLIIPGLPTLTGPDARLPAVDAAVLAEPLRDWCAAAHQSQGPVRVCFRLIEPREHEESWRVELALQPAGDPSLYVPAVDVWRGTAVHGVSGDPEEALLVGLGRASRVFRGLDDALRDARPSEVAMPTGEAFGFLKETAPALSAMGFGVRLPRWAGAGRRRLGLKLTASSPRGPGAADGQGLDLGRVVDFRYDLAVGDGTLSPEEIEELARLKAPLVRLRGQWIELDQRQLEAALKVMREGVMTAGEVVQEVIDGGPEGVPLLSVEADGALGDLLSGEAERRLTPIATPAALDGTLRPYQERGLAWLAFMSSLGLGAVLADDMGLGKTLQTLSLLTHEKELRSAGDPRPTLLICPMSLLGNWQREAARFTPSLRVYVHHGTGRLRDAELSERVAGSDLVLTTYGTASRDHDELAAISWHRVVCDEAQAIKNSATRQARAVRSLRAGSRLALTGTPMENHLAELWSIMEFCNPGLLGAAASFRKRYQEPIERDRDAEAAAALKRATGPFVLRRLKTDKSIISDLPEKMEIKEWCTLTQEQATLYKAVVDEMMTTIEDTEGIERRGNVLAAMAKLKQVCNHPAHLLKDGSRLPGRSGKLARLEELCAELVAEGDKALCFTQYAEFGELLQPYLSARLDRPVLWLHGGLPARRRQALVDRFQERDEPMIFLLSLKAAGTGLNLTAANHVIHIDRWWNPAVEDQATDRAFRIGQTRNVQVRKFICIGTLEERIDEMIERKRDLAAQVVGSGEDWLTSLSVDELREVFALSPSAVAS